MAQYIQYQLEDGSELWVEFIDKEGGVVRASVGEKIQVAKQSFESALEGVKQSSLQLRKQLKDSQADEVEIKFGLKATGNLGNNLFAIAGAGVEANYEVTLKWKKEADQALADRNRGLRRKRLMRNKN